MVNGPKMPKIVNRKTGCARCHVETSFRTFPGGWDHAKWTGFVIDGAHETAGCAACHAPLDKPDEHGRTWARAKGRQCSNCHEDPHAGQFVKRGTTDCRRCHKSASSFLNLAFRHNLDSRFRLGPQHKHVACTQCHKKERIGDKEVVRYRPIPRKCTDCHGSQDDPLRRRGRGGKR